jgi:hypothetical protein
MTASSPVSCELTPDGWAAVTTAVPGVTPSMRLRPAFASVYDTEADTPS